jgi:hypothetical protein
MKVFAIGAITNPPPEDQRDKVLSREVPHTLQLYLDGKIEQFWFRQDRLGVVFYLQAESLEDAKATLDTLPLVEGGFMSFELIPVGPLAPLGRLIPAK